MQITFCLGSKADWMERERTMFVRSLGVLVSAETFRIGASPRFVGIVNVPCINCRVM